jgi:hypothetical protein
MSDRDQQIAEGLIKLTDRCSEALANHQGPHGETGTLDSLLEINELVWELRWQVGLYAGEKELKPDGEAGAVE